MAQAAYAACSGVAGSGRGVAGSGRGVAGLRAAAEIAIGLIRAWLRLPIQETTIEVMSDALEIKAASGLSYWDAAVIAAARALGCTELMSEDMSHGQTIGGVAIVNPFR